MKASNFVVKGFTTIVHACTTTVRGFTTIEHGFTMTVHAFNIVVKHPNIAVYGFTIIAYASTAAVKGANIAVGGLVGPGAGRARHTLGRMTAMKLPKSVRDHARSARFGEIPVLLAHPDWVTPAPVCLWLHGRTASKELDPGRYARWLRAGIGVCAIDLPGHGQRADPPRQGPGDTVAVIAEAVAEIDAVVAGLDGFGGVFDTGRAAIGGMSMGGMIALRRLCGAHPFVCAAVEATCGDLAGLYFPEPGDGVEPWPAAHDPAAVARVDPMAYLDGFEPLPLLALHSEADEMVPWRVQARFLERLREHFAKRGGSDDLIEVHTWPETGAPAEHVGFGRFSNDAKNLQTAFLRRHLIGDQR